MEQFVDLHIHSCYSDGTMTPEEIVVQALQNHVGTLAITDHDVLEASIELKELCAGQELHFISGVELDALDNSNNIHILGYGINLDDELFHKFVRRNRSMLDLVNSKLIEKMQDNYADITIQDYEAFSYDRKKGGWKALHYLLAKGLTGSLREGFAFYPKYSCSYDCVDFPSVHTVCEEIHKAGGKAVLAHPGVSIKEPSMDLFKIELLRYLEFGIDGMECFYPTHSEEITKLCQTICNERGLLITSGSDCHGDFGKSNIGEMRIIANTLNLGNL